MFSQIRYVDFMKQIIFMQANKFNTSYTHWREFFDPVMRDNLIHLLDFWISF